MKLFYFLIISFVALGYANRLDNIDPICMQPSVTGMCRGYFPRYYYSSTSGKCEKFIYGGCGGNKNNFLTAQGCNKACHA